MSDKKISDIAQELGVSRQAIYKRVNRTLTTKLTPFVYKDESGTILIKPRGVAIIKDSFVSTSCQQVDTTIDSSLQQNLIDLMKEQLEALKAQLETKDKQISDLSRQLEIMQHLFKTEQEKGLMLIENKPQKVSGLKRWFNKER